MVLPFAKKLQDESGRLKQRAVERSVMRQQQARTLNTVDNNDGTGRKKTTTPRPIR